MSSESGNISRRSFLAAGGSAAAGIGMLAGNWFGDLQETSFAADIPPRPGAADGSPLPPLKLAAINSIYRLRSHAYHIVGRFIHGFRRDGFPYQPAAKVVAMVNDQSPPDDLGPRDCQRYNIELCQTIEQALLGPDGLGVDGVLLIIEHGDYPINARGQILYPRFELFEKITEVFRKAGRSVPVFVDKHLSYDYEKAARMMALSRELKFPLMAGSSLPVTWRVPELEPPLGTRFTEGLATLGYDRGAAEIYLFHALETLQCLLERRAGGETGVKSVQALKGPAVWKAADEGRWSWKLLEAALARSPSCNVGPVRENVTEPLALLIEYLDGTRGTVLNLIEQTSDLAFAGQIAGQAEPVATCMYLPPPPGARFFDPLTYHIEQFMRNRQSSYPVERTWLTSTILDLGLRSLAEDNRVITSPALDIRYAPPASTGFFRGPVVDQP